MRRTLAVVVALAFVLSACSGKKDHYSDGSPTSSAPVSIQSAAAGGELGSPILDGNDTGHFVPLKSVASYETLKAGAATTTQNGSLLTVKSADGGPFIVSMEDDAVNYLRVNKGWTVDQIGHDPAWRPSLSGAVPHVTVGSRWVVRLQPTTTDEDGQNDAASGALIEAYDATDKTYYTTTAIDTAHTLFMKSLHVVDDHRFSFVFADGPLDDTRIPYIIRRTVDLTTFRFVDEAVDIGNTNRMVAVTTLDDGYLVDLQRPTSERDGVFVRFQPGASDPTLQLTMKEAPAPNTIDGFRVDGGAKALTLVGANGTKTALPADFASATVAGAVNNLVYLRYTAAAAKAISADGLALVDVSKGTVTTAFDLSGANRDATGPAADAKWATGSSQVLLVGVPAL